MAERESGGVSRIVFFYVMGLSFSQWALVAGWHRGVFGNLPTSTTRGAAQLIKQWREKHPQMAPTRRYFVDHALHGVNL